MSPDATARGVTTRRIRRRARIWHDWQFPGYSETPVEQLRRLAAPRLYHEPRPALTKAELRALVDDAKAGTVRHFRDQLRALRRESAHMRNYHREYVIKWLGNLRRWPEAEAALATVSAELQEFDL